MTADINIQDALDLPLIKVKDKLTWTARQAVEGVQIFGGIGSGKTSGSGRTLALKYLAAGYGGLVLTVKPDEKRLWQEEYCKITNRSSDLLILEPGGELSFNFFDYEALHSGAGSALTENIVQVLKTVIRAGQEKSHGRGDDPFWEDALDMLMFNVIDLCKLGQEGKVSVEGIYEIVQSLPRDGSNVHRQFLKDYGITEGDDDDNREVKTALPSIAYQRAYLAAYNLVKDKYNAWWEGLTTDEMSDLKSDRHLLDRRMSEAVPEARLLKYIEAFIDSFLDLNEKTRSIIDFSFSGFLFRLLRDPIYSLFCSRPCNVFPEDCAKGKIILINLPVKQFHKVGRDCQIMLKYIWQRAMEKRPVQKDTPPVFLWADEAQNFLHEHDPDFLATARSSRIATVYISQNVPNYRANMGGANAEHKVKSFLGTMATKLFHANADIETNRYASDLIGDTFFLEKSSTASYVGTSSASETDSLKIDKKVRPEDFGRLRTGGEYNKDSVDAIAHFQSAILNDKLNHTKLEFSQKFQPILNSNNHEN